MSKLSFGVLLASLLMPAATLPSGSAAAAPVSHFLLRLPVASQILPGRLTLAPLSAVKFCLSRPDQCRAAPEEILNFDTELFETLREVNLSINRQIRPAAKVYAAANNWSIDPVDGDCNDYAVSKRHALLRAGLPASALLLAAVQTSAGEGHLVLLVRTDRGDYVLDNLSSQVRPAHATGYAWTKVQSASNPLYWHEAQAVRSGSTLTLAAN